MSKIVIGIDVGGSTTKIVGFEGARMITPTFVKAGDPIASAYGAFGKFTAENKIKLSGKKELPKKESKEADDPKTEAYASEKEKAVSEKDNSEK